MNTATDNVMSLLTSLGFDAESHPEIKIDTFDQWPNVETAVVAICSGSQALVAH